MSITGKFSKEGYLVIDHRDSPGLPEETVYRAGLPPGAGHGIFEAPTYTCSHCCRVVVMNPNRRRDRAYCSKCDRYICDGCGAHMSVTGVCVPFKQICDEIQKQNSTGG